MTDGENKTLLSQKFPVRESLNSMLLDLPF